MLHEEKKVAKIVEELTMFFFGIGGRDITSSIQVKGRKATIVFTSNYEESYAHKISCIERMLNSKRNDGIEDIYWELAGSGDPGETSQLLLIGMMIDKATITNKDGYVSIRLEKTMI